jgi:hypothetical protein
VASGTLGRYFNSSFNYALFFLTPYLALALLTAMSIAAGGLVVLALGASLPSAALAAAVALAAFALLMRALGRRWRVQHCLAIWIFSRDYLLGKRPDVENRIDAFASRIAARCREGGVDEIVCVGHSIGTILLVEVMARVLDRDPDIGRRVKLALLTVGSTLPKLYLHPAGGPMHARAKRLAAQPAIDWAEYQSRGDAISFYKFHPIALKPTGATTEAIKPHVRPVSIRAMMSPGSRWRRAMRHMRRHYQFVMANEQLANYDYFMFICGPVPAAAPYAQALSVRDGERAARQLRLFHVHLRPGAGCPSRARARGTARFSGRRRRAPGGGARASMRGGLADHPVEFAGHRVGIDRGHDSHGSPCSIRSRAFQSARR